MELRQSIFIQTLARCPYRIALGVFFALLNCICGITTNAHFYSDTVSSFAFRSASAPPFSLCSLLGAALWQLMLCSAAWYAKKGDARLAAAFAAISLESFVLGFSVSELLFCYSGKSSLFALLLILFCGILGIFLRISCMLPDFAIHTARTGQKRTRRPFFAVLRPLVFLIFAQGILLPRLLCS